MRAKSGGNGTGQNANTLTNSGNFNSTNATRNLSLGTFNVDVKVGLGPVKLKVYGQGVYSVEDYDFPLARIEDRGKHLPVVFALRFALHHVLRRSSNTKM